MTVECPICGKTFDSFRGLNGHMNAHIPSHRKRAEECEHHFEMVEIPMQAGHKHEVGWANAVGMKSYHMVCTHCDYCMDCFDEHEFASETMETNYATAVIEPNENEARASKGVEGVVRFTQAGPTLHIDYDITSLFPDGEHGFHIHTYGDLTDGCESACAHFNPDGETHGGLKSQTRHLGDLGNITSKGGISKGRISTDSLSLNMGQVNCIVGRMIIVHQDPDDLGLGGDAESLKTGNAGKRLGCGVIGLAKGKEMKADMESPDNEDRFILDITCDWCGEPYDGTEVLDNWEGRIIHRRCAASDDYEAESVSIPPCVICGDQVVMITEDMGECISCNTFWNVVELSDLWEQDVPDVLVLDAEYEQYLMCDGCGWTTPSFRVGDAYCHDCDMEVPDDVDRIDHIDCDLEVMDEEDVQEQLEFWLYEHHPDFCPAGGRVYDADWQGISLAGGIDEIEEMLKRRKL